MKTLVIKGLLTEDTAEKRLAEYVRANGFLPKKILISPFYLHIAKIIFELGNDRIWLGIKIDVDPKFYELE